MYEIVSGPLVWVAFFAFLAGLTYEFVSTAKGARKDRIVYPYMSVFYGLRSLVHWVIPFASTNMRRRPEMTIVAFAFHICLILTPLFLLGHNLWLDRSLGVRLWSLPEGAAHAMALIVILSGMFLLVRRWMLPEVRFVTTATDYLLLAIVLLPFVTGFIAHEQWIPYKTTLIAHMLSGEIMLVAIPFTRLRHMLFFPFTRAYMGSEFGAVRHAKDW
jgi:nitrate reductase gamma subunit